jgi:hypothetical protein
MGKTKPDKRAAYNTAAMTKSHRKAYLRSLGLLPQLEYDTVSNACKKAGIP